MMTFVLGIAVGSAITAYILGDDSGSSSDN